MNTAILPQFDDVFQRLKAVNIRDALPLFITPVVRGNREWYVCPFHNDHRPSATIYGKSNKLKCFACGKSADLPECVAALNGVGQLEGAQIAAERLGIALDKPLTPEKWKEIRKRHERRELEHAWQQGKDALFRMACDMRDAMLAVTTPEDADGETIEMLAQLENLIDVLMYGKFEDIALVLNGGWFYGAG